MSDSKISLPLNIEFLKDCLDPEPDPMDPRLRVLMGIAIVTRNPELMQYVVELKVDVMTPCTPIEKYVLSAIGIDLQ